MEQQTLKALLQAVAQTVIAHAEELTTLDQAIGDGDHGLNMKRGFERVSELADSISQQPLPQALTEVGKTLVMTVGGASGPLYGTFFMTFGKELPVEPTVADVSQAFNAAIAAVERRGKSSAGQKTLIDVLVPVQEELSAGAQDVLQRVNRTAQAAAAATIPMLAVRGRASFLGERSIGHMDPGARSSALVISALCDFLGD
ncbi:dihydroxyacetone kinase subunit L [Trinickia dabaoshanensis]|uniref:Dihydroxyacetone kinase subunit L n=1 Tax=Trinickia dabaoshanensis TaxID=564714 RepID=A0A2N7VHR0_9BURK|nr:dihydroxyacetone kinase subunit DhaL [Trinickia dabaoshanensis]PMS16682.1 dihydroxyacetone kinase subunit L [Trinickia dabaoshanensis]